MSGCGRTLFWIGFTERTISNLKHSTHSICSKLSTIVVPRQNGPCQEKNRLFYDFLPESTTFVLWRTAKTWMQPSTKTKDTFEPSNETVSDEKTAHGRKQMYKWECQAAGRAFFCTTSQALRASFPGRKDSLRRRGIVCGMPRPLLQGEVSPKVTERLHEG